MKEKNDEMPSENSDPKDLLERSDEFTLPDIPPDVDRRTFLMRSAVIGAAAVMTGRTVSAQDRLAGAKVAASTKQGTPPPPPLSPDLNVVKKSKGPVMTTLDEFYKVGPGPSSSHTIGPMRITYDFYQRCTKLPADQLAKATGAQGAPVRQPQRHGQGPRHRARRTCGIGRKGAGNRGSRISRRPARQARPVFPGEARRQDRECHAQGRRLRRGKGRLPASRTP